MDDIFPGKVNTSGDRDGSCITRKPEKTALTTLRRMGIIAYIMIWYGQPKSQKPDLKCYK